MTYRYVFALGLSTVLLGACTIVHEPAHPPPPPPPPPGHQQQPPEPGATATPGTDQPRKQSGANLLKFLKNTKPPPAEGGGNLVVQVVDGTCVIKIDAEDYGEQAQVNAQVAAGEHVVSCAPKKGDVQSHTVAVTEGGQPTTVVFSVTTGAESKTVPGPPVGRPEIPTQ
ncbi:MAG: hypothetical protein JRI68_30830 [Deltaproteobacteria bacterium]|nr:hypothetical protein [Deltaproteobacteria bacterium]